MDVECEACDDGGEMGKRHVKVVPNPKQPTEKEVKEHNVTHTPYRSWCPHCVTAAARASVLIVPFLQMQMELKN